MGRGAVRSHIGNGAVGNATDMVVVVVVVVVVHDDHQNWSIAAAGATT